MQTGNISSKVLLLTVFSMDDNADKNIATVQRGECILDRGGAFPNNRLVAATRSTDEHGNYLFWFAFSLIHCQIERV